MLFLVVFLLVDAAVLLWWRRADRERRYDPQIQSAADRYGVHPALVKAVVWQESRYRADARGTKGELGLMQIRELAAREWADAEGLADFQHERLSNPALNVQAGTWYLRKLLLRYRGTDAPMIYALADYNAGRSNVLRWAKGEGSTNSAVFLAQMDYPGTRKYVDSVTARFQHYRPIVEFQAAKK
jgi:soluble lytic murein transglycosylase